MFPFILKKDLTAVILCMLCINASSDEHSYHLPYGEKILVYTADAPKKLEHEVWLKFVNGSLDDIEISFCADDQPKMQVREKTRGVQSNHRVYFFKWIKRKKRSRDLDKLYFTNKAQDFQNRVVVVDPDKQHPDSGSSHWGDYYDYNEN